MPMQNQVQLLYRGTDGIVLGNCMHKKCIYVCHRGGLHESHGNYVPKLLKNKHFIGKLKVR